MRKEEKIKLGEEYHGIFTAAASAVLVNPQGLTVSDTVELRKKLNESGSSLKMLKNRVAIKAAAGTPFEQLSSEFSSMRAIAYNAEDGVAPAKTIVEFSKEHENNFSIVGGVLVFGEYIDTLDAAGVVELSKMPAREELIAKVLFLMNAPITNFARTLNEIPTSFVRTLQAVADSK